MVSTNMTYEQFEERIRRQNKSQEELLKAYEKVFLPLLKKWDGKVYNRRFRTAIEQELEAQGFGNLSKIYVSEESQHHEEVTLVLKQYLVPGDWNRYEVLYIQLIVKYDDGNYRISEADTISNERGQAWLNNARENIAERKKAVKNWKKYMKQAEQLQAAIKAYNELPHCFRENIIKYQFNIY